MEFKNIFWGTILIILGALLLFQELFDIELKRFFWPVLLIAGGAVLIFKDKFNNNQKIF